MKQLAILNLQPMAEIIEGCVRTAGDRWWFWTRFVGGKIHRAEILASRAFIGPKHHSARIRIAAVDIHYGYSMCAFQMSWQFCFCLYAWWWIKCQFASSWFSIFRVWLI
jgi:hypothetical protein